jgi:predicted dehydrogenase
VTGTGRVGVGIIGAGVISAQYLDNLTRFPDLDVVFIADLDLERARAQAENYGVPGSGSVDELLAVPEIEIVVNLTIPAAHVEVALRILAAGKNVWSEKPFALDRESGRRLLSEANRWGLRVASAPDTFLGAGLQTGLRTIERDEIGRPLTALALFQTPGPESWHPNPEFLFDRGAGPLFDMAPYYLTLLVQVFGPVRRVSATASKALETRIIGSGPRAGTEFPVVVPTHHGALIEFENGGSAQMVFSFESHRLRMGFVEITGVDGTIAFPDPNGFDGESRVWHAGSTGETVIEAVGSTWSRGAGVLELARAIRADRPERATGELAYHVLDVMVSIAESAESGEPVAVQSTVVPPAPLVADWDPAAATL